MDGTARGSPERARGTKWKGILPAAPGQGGPGEAAQHRKDVPRRAKPRADWILNSGADSL